MTEETAFSAAEAPLDPDTRETLAGIMTSRLNVYSLLSRLYRTEVDRNLVDDLAGFTLETADVPLAQTAADLKASLDAACADGIETGLEGLAVTFDRVFFGMGPLTARHAFPYESVYTSDRGIMMQEAFSQVVSIYREQRLAKEAGFAEPEDHLAVELAFMATLAQRTGAFLGAGTAEGDKAADQTVCQSLGFLDDHLLNWVGRFAADLQTAADGDGGGFYGAVARFTLRFLQTDRELLAAMTA